MTGVEVDDLATFLAGHPPFDALDRDVLVEIARVARVERFGAGELVMDAFARAGTELFVVVSGRVELWSSADEIAEPADESLGPGGVFGFSAMLTERSVGPRAVAGSDSVVARIPAPAVAPAFASRRGARFLAERVAAPGRRTGVAPSLYSTVDELVVRPPLVVDAATPIADTARRMTELGVGYAAVRRDDGSLGLVTDALLREWVVGGTMPAEGPVGALAAPSPPTVRTGDSAAEALILMLERDAEFVLVVDRDGLARGVIAPRDVAVSSATSGASTHEQLRRAGTVEELATRARRVPTLLGDLLSHGVTSGRVVAIHSTILDTIVRRAITLIFTAQDDLSTDAFTWLSLGSTGRREATLSSDVDSAVAFDDGVPEAEQARYRSAFGQVYDVLAAAGLSGDAHGATAAHPSFARTHAQWAQAGRQWVAAPEQNEGAIMTSLLLDGRPIHGDPGLPAVAAVFGDLRRHPGTMRLLLQQSLSRRATLWSLHDLVTRRFDRFDLKGHALLPIVNLARWAALSVGSAELSTTERLRAASGSAMLPAEQAATLVEVFEVLQRVRLRYQLLQYGSGEPPSDVFVWDRMSPLDRSVVAQAIREVSAVQRRMDNVALYVPAEEWSGPDRPAGPAET